MKYFLPILFALSAPGFAFGEGLCFFVLPTDAAAPESNSSLAVYRAQNPKLDAPALEVKSLVAAETLNTSTSRSIFMDETGRPVTVEERPRTAVLITMLPGDRAKFATLTESNKGHRFLAVLGDSILMAPTVWQRIDTSSFQVTLGERITGKESAEIIQGLQSLVKKPEVNSTDVPPVLQRN